MKYDSSNPRHKLAKDFSTAFVANRMRVTYRTAQNYVSDDVVGEFWLVLADLAFKADEESAKATINDYIPESENVSDLEN